MLIRALAIASMLVVTATLPASAASKDITVSSRIDAVTVYARSARVTRLAKIDLPAGDVRVTLEGVTDHLIDDSLRVAGAGVTKAQIFGATVERVPHVETTAKEVRAAEDNLTALKD